MLATFIALSLCGQTPKSFADLELEKIKAYHGLKTFHEEMQIDYKMGDQVGSLHRSTFLDGDKEHTVVNVESPGKFECISDGKQVWTIVFAAKKYAEFKVDPNEKFDPQAELLNVAQDAFNFTFSSGKPIQFACEPAPTPSGNETVQERTETLRRVTFQATSRKGNHMTITQWFAPDKWVVKRFLVEGTGEGGQFSLKGEAPTLDFRAVISPSEFKFDPARVDGFEKTDTPILWPLGGG